MNETVEAAILQALINANISRNLKAKVDEILKIKHRCKLSN